MLSLDSLHCFVEAARFLNFRLAARSVALTPAALGNRIHQLEDQVGASLFHRTTRRVVLTEAGLALLPHARQTLLDAEVCGRAARGEIGPAPVELTCGTRHELGLSWIVPMLPHLRVVQPGLTMHVYFGSSADLLARVRTVEIDCAVGSMRVNDPKLDSVRLHQEKYVFVGQPKLLAMTPLRSAADARQHTIIDTGADLPLFGYWRDAPGGGDRLRFARLLRIGTIAAIRDLVRAGEGVAVLPEYLVAADLKQGHLVRVFPRAALLSDYFRLIFRTDDPRRSLYEAIARTMLTLPLR